MHYYKFNIGDYKSHTEHLEPMEDLAFRRMMDWCYLHEKPLPNSIDEIARLIRMRSHSDCIAYVLETYFECNADGYANSRIMKEVDAYQAKSDKAKKSAQARWNKQASKDNGLVDANALQTDNEGNAKHKTLNTKQETTLNGQSEIEPKIIDKAFDFFWQHYPKKVGKKKAESSFKSIMKGKSDDSIRSDVGVMVNHMRTALAKLEEGDNKFMGYDNMNPTTYLNQERWNDEL